MTAGFPKALRLHLLAGFVLIAEAWVPGCAERGGPDGAAKTSEVPASAPQAQARGEVAPQAAAGPGADKIAVRKIIYTAELELSVSDFAKAEQAIPKLAQRFQGYVADTDVAGQTGGHRYGTWKVRVPVGQFEAFLEAVIQLGELQRRQTNSQDVTEEYFDLEARIKNKKVEETRLLKHLEESTGKLSEILDVERELSRVREESERMEGRRRLLENLTSLTTVTIRLFERGGYRPPETPTFTTQIGRAFWGSVKVLEDFGKAVVLVAVAILPWLPVFILIAAVLWWLARRARRRQVLVMEEAA